MKKAAWVRIAVTVEGEADPAQDFGKLAVEVVRASIKIQVPARYKGTRVFLNRIYEDPTPPEDEIADDSSPQTAGGTANSPTRPGTSSAKPWQRDRRRRK